MNEKQIIEFLTNKIYLLGEEHLKLIKDGDFKKARRINFEMEKVSEQIKKISFEEVKENISESHKLK